MAGASWTTAPTGPSHNTCRTTVTPLTLPCHTPRSQGGSASGAPCRLSVPTGRPAMLSTGRSMAQAMLAISSRRNSTASSERPCCTVSTTGGKNSKGASPRATDGSPCSSNHRHGRSPGAASSAAAAAGMRVHRPKSSSTRTRNTWATDPVARVHGTENQSSPARSRRPRPSGRDRPARRRGRRSRRRRPRTPTIGSPACRRTAASAMASSRAAAAKA